MANEDSNPLRRFGELDAESQARVVEIFGPAFRRALERHRARKIAAERQLEAA